MEGVGGTQAGLILAAGPRAPGTLKGSPPKQIAPLARPGPGPGARAAYLTAVGGGELQV